MQNAPYPQFRLDQWSSMRLQLLWAYQKRMNLPTTAHSHTYHFQTAALVQNGWASTGQSETNRIHAKAGQWLIFKQGKRWQQFSPDCELLSIGYRFQLPTGEALYDKGLPVAFPASQHPQLEREARKVLHLMKKHVGEGFLPSKQIVDMRHYLLSQNALRTFLIELATILHKCGVHPESMRQGHPQVSQTLEIINSTPISELGKSGSPQTIAHNVGLSSTHLDRLMVEETGHTVFKHIDIRRLRTAQDALLADQTSMKAIAYTLGFSSPAHFNSWFRKRMQTTPLQFRKQGILA
ncbi:helix-turn-helix domain-containing protein [Coraliomargarita parva]|uniref:helix-turn-helix domain-containing protein n=1 Tax=Coraliomargarita parva TaxID=3014050 RepID=UPI0022B448F1|nr:AraC family transcriptional regulator [Coraliomargarita parva]